MDLGATEWATFRKVTLPMIAPGVGAAALLAAAISIDDYVITSFNAGQTQTFPLFIFGATRQGVPPEVNVLATCLLIGVLILMGLNVLLQRRLARREMRRDVVEEAYDAVLRLVREVRRLRRREDRAKDALRTSLAVGDAGSVKSAIEDVLDDSV